ncbi:unnamed protein product [Cyprideis torosa]|uniref:Uncharacterized protein n=1 Tax=Cyprideis torosa TaxID=163714 RepID=A0A7R8W483_9CRUS|nr:unnamed protein product [Cyprideis torosa]CAG0879584.1 unnamed protein product [Cyprideis torosa]
MSTFTSPLSELSTLTTLASTTSPLSTSTEQIDLEYLRSLFSWVDYLVFALLLAVSAAIGIFYGFFKKQDSEDFLMAGRSMSTFPMSMSLIARPTTSLDVCYYFCPSKRRTASPGAVPASDLSLLPVRRWSLRVTLFVMSVSEMATTISSSYALGDFLSSSPLSTEPSTSRLPPPPSQLNLMEFSNKSTHLMDHKSFMSAITLLGTPAEMYQYGTMYWLIGFSYFPVMLSTMYCYMPVFYNLEVTSAYEYLEVRFSSGVRKLGSAIFATQMTMYMAIVVYAPSLALSQVTGVNVYLSVCLIFGVCIFYTVLGGMKAVIWTDTVQVIIMYVTIVGVILKGTFDEGGFAAVWKVNDDSGRIEFNDFRLNPTVRHTFWSLVVGGYFTWIAIYGVNQAQVQRYLTVPTMKQARNALWINMVGLFLLMTICSFAGLVVYSKYADCDPLKAGTVGTSDQLFPLFVMDTLGKLRGIPGVFVAGIFSGALSTVSSGLNSLAAITLEDFVRPILNHFGHEMTDQTSTKVSKGIALAYGGLSFALVFVAEQLGDTLTAALSIFGMIGGPLVGVFTLGMFFPWANYIGAYCGAASGLLFTFWIGLGAEFAKHKGQLKIPFKPMGECSSLNLNETTTLAPDGDEAPGEAMGLYRISYMWYSTIGCLTVITVGMITSFMTGAQDPQTLNPNTISPGAHYVMNKMPTALRDKINWYIGTEYDKTEESALRPDASTVISLDTFVDSSPKGVGHSGQQDNPAFGLSVNGNGKKL